MANEFKLSYTAKEIDDKLGEIDNAVKITAQTLTDEQKAQARENIGAAAVGEAGGGAAQTDWKDITNKPVITEGSDTLTWDGNTEGLVSAGDDASGFVYKVSDVVVNANDIPEEGILAYSAAFGGEAQISKKYLTITEDGCIIGDALIIVPYDNYDATEAFGEPLVVPKKGLYLLSLGEPISITIPGYTGFGKEKIDPSYLYQPDWNQINETAPDFIKNKPFGDTETVILEEQVLTYSEEDGGYIGMTSNPIQEGATVTVVLDGNSYTSEAVDMGAIVFGNLAMLGPGVDNEQPFYGVYVEGMVAITTSFDNVSPLTVKITAKKAVPISNKYLPKTIFYVNSEDNYIYMDKYCTTKATAEDIPDNTDFSLSVVMDGVCLMRAKPVSITTKMYTAIYHPFKTVSVVAEGDISELYTAEYTPET